ncbi:MAG: glycosyltransferase family 4 protein [Parcubacteria group bacterium]|nr:glycosyltransferase family 4 protein [Parcubacteria group bacterium]
MIPEKRRKAFLIAEKKNSKKQSLKLFLTVLKKEMRILVDIRLLSKGGTSGIEEYTRSLLGALLEIDRKNEYLLFYNGFSKIAEPIDLKKNPNAEIVNWKIPNKLFDFSARFLNRPKLDDRFGADVVFSPHFNILGAGKRAKRVITFHDLSFIHHPDFFSRRRRLWHKLQDYKRRALEADRIIAVSDFTRSDLIRTLGVSPEKTRTIYSGVSGSFRPIAAADGTLQEFLNRKKLAAPYLLYLGTIEPRKNIIAVIRAFNEIKGDSRLSDRKLVLAGGRGWLYKEVLKTAERSPYRNDILFFGRVEPEERKFLYNGAEIFVYPSFFEGFGFPPLEAMACGTPVVVSNRSSFPEIIGDSAPMIDPWRAGELSAMIKSVLLNGELRRALVVAGLRNAAGFDWKKTARETLETLMF